MIKKRILVLCEFTGVVRDAFIRKGHFATSCDLIPSEKPGPHLLGHAQDLDIAQYDLMIAFPPCTYLCRSGARWWKDKELEQEFAISFFLWIAGLPIKRKAIENPIGIMSTIYRKPDQIIQPWQFGHGETKATCLWLWGLPQLVPTLIVSGREQVIHRMQRNPNRSKDRSRTYFGVARAMADQWG